MECSLPVSTTSGIEYITVLEVFDADQQHTDICHAISALVLKLACDHRHAAGPSRHDTVIEVQNLAASLVQARFPRENQQHIIQKFESMYLTVLAYECTHLIVLLQLDASA